MIILRSLFKHNKGKVFSSFPIQHTQKIIYQPINSFFWGKGKKTNDDENLKKFKEMNQEYKTLKEVRKFMINTEKKKSFLSEEEKLKQEKALQKTLKDYLDSYKFDKKFEELKFINLLSAISYTYDNSPILKDPRFGDLVEEVAEKLRDFTDTRSVILFLSFCSHNDINRPLIWENFNSFIRNKSHRFSFDEKLSILSSYNKENAEELEEFFELFENDFIKGFKNEKGGYDFLSIFRVLTLYRNFNKGSENFLYTIEEIVKQNIDNLSMDEIALFLTHYVTNPLENQLTKHDIITKIEKRLLQSHVFLNNSQIMSVLFGFIKYGKGSDEFYELMQRRTLTVLDTFSVEQLKRIILLYANLPKYAMEIFVGIEKYVIENLKKIPRGFISTLFQTFAELGYRSERLYNHSENILVKNIFNMENEELSKNLWAFAMQGSPDDLFFKKAAECVKAKIEKFNAKELSTFIWSFSYVDYKDEELYDLIEEEIYAKLQTSSYSIRDMALILWAYVQKVPLRPPTVDLIKTECLKQKKEAEAWDIAIILWGFNKFEPYPVGDFFKGLQDVSKELIPEMTNYELSISLRAYAETNVGDLSLYKVFEEKTLEVLEGMNYNEVISCVYSFSILTCVDGGNFKEVIEKLKTRAKQLQSQLQVTKEEELKKEKLDIDLQSVEMYLKNEAMDKLRNQ